jgi:hypothetical protein
MLRIVSLTPADKDEDAQDDETNQDQPPYDRTGYDAAYVFGPVKYISVQVRTDRSSPFDLAGTDLRGEVVGRRSRIVAGKTTCIIAGTNAEGAGTVPPRINVSSMPCRHM